MVGLKQKKGPPALGVPTGLEINGARLREFVAGLGQPFN
jgi:hypothetical protein